MINELEELRLRIASLEAGGTRPGKYGADLEDIKRKFELVADNINEVIFIFSPDWQDAYYLSPAYENIWGRPVEDVYRHARAWMEAIVPGDLDRMAAFIDGQARGEVAYENSIDFRIRTPDGNVRWIHGRTYPVRDEQGKIYRITGIAEDVTGRKIAEEGLLKSEKFLNNIFDCFQDGISILDRDLNIVRVNHVMEKWHPYMVPLEGKKCFHVYHERSAPCEKCPSIRAIETGTAQSEVIPFHGENNVLRGWLELFAYPMTDDRGNVVGVIEHVRDITQRKNAEESLILMQQMIDQAQDEASLAGHDGRFYYVNDAKCRSLGYTRKELLSMNVWDVDPDLTPETWARAWQVLKEKGHIKLETRHRTKDGRIFPTEIWSTYFDFRGKEYVCAFVRDIAERKKAENALREASAYNRSLIEASLDPLVMIAPDGRITDVNAATEAVTGLPREALVGTDFSDYFTEPAKAREGYLTVFREGSVTDYPLEIRHRAGDVTPVIYNASVYRDEAGQVIGVFAAARDVTERKRAEEALKESEEKFRVLAETTMAGIMLYRGKKIVYVNPALEHITGYSKGELLGMNYWDMVDPDQKEMVRSRGLARQQGLNTPSTYEIKIRTGSGKTRWVELSAALISFHGRQTGLATIFDITDRKRSEAELQDAKGQAELYLDLMGHDINNLNQIGIGFLEIALGTLKLDRESRELIARPLEAIEASSRLIANVRKLQRVKEGGVKFKEVLIADRLREIIPRYGDVPGRDIRIGCDAGCGCTVMANDLLDDVFANIIHNAIKHSTGPLAIDIHLSTAKVGDRKYALVAIEDDGPGIPDELKGRLFSRSGHNNAKATGRGLGLHLVRTLVEDFNGKVWAEDRVCGDHTKGTRIVIMLPAVDTKDTKDTG